MRKFCNAGYFGLAAATVIGVAVFAASAQETAGGRGNFAIARGTSFSASAPKGVQPAASELPPGRLEQVTLDLEEALIVIRRNYAGKNGTDGAELTKSSIDGMLRSLDPHSNYFDAREYANLLEEQQSEYFGIGTTIASYKRTGRLETYVLNSYPGSPAAAGGLRFGDRIISVNGRPTSDLGSEAVSDMIRGRVGSAVKLSVVQADSGKAETIELRRARVPQPSVTNTFLLRPGVGYIGLTGGFTFTTAREFDAAMRSLKKQGSKSIVIDLRGNPGGILEQAVKVAERFLPAGDVIVTQRGRSRFDNRVWKSANASPETMPVTLLVDGDTASASEILAGALQDHDRALIVGQKTFGKGLVQSVIDLPQGAGLTLTTARYFTPSGRSIQRDYAAGSLYEYYRHRDENVDNTLHLPGAETANHRKVFGGDGIMPDEFVPDEQLPAESSQLIDPVFFFTLDLAAGRIKGLEKYAVRAPTSSPKRVRNELPSDAEVLAAFKDYLSADSEWSRLAGLTLSQSSTIASQIRGDLALAAAGSDAAARVRIEADQQVAKAVQLLPRAEQLARIGLRPQRAAGTHK